MIDIKWHPSRNELRVFSGLLIAFFALVAAMIVHRTGSTTAATIVLGGATAVGLAGLIVPPAMRPVYRIWMLAAFPIGWTVSHLILAAIFYLLFTPIGLLLRIAGKDAMQRKFERDKKSYWEETSTRRELRSYFRQY